MSAWVWKPKSLENRELRSTHTSPKIDLVLLKFNSAYFILAGVLTSFCTSIFTKYLVSLEVSLVLAPVDPPVLAPLLVPVDPVLTVVESVVAGTAGAISSFLLVDSSMELMTSGNLQQLPK